MYSTNEEMENTIVMTESSKVKYLAEISFPEIKKTVQNYKRWFKNDEKKLKQIDEIVSHIDLWCNDILKLSKDMLEIEYMSFKNRIPTQKQINDIHDCAYSLSFDIKKEISYDYKGILEDEDVVKVFRKAEELEKFAITFIEEFYLKKIGRFVISF